MNPRAWLITTAALLTHATSAPAQVRVQDVAKLQGQRTNPLLGYGLVVGLSGTGDGGKNQVTMRALMSMHRRFAQEMIGTQELRANNSVALVAVEAEIPEFGGREGQRVDVRVSTLGEAKSLRGGRLLATPLQYAMFDPQRPETQAIFAIAAGSVELPDEETPTTGLIRGGAVLEEDFFYNFVQDGLLTLVIHDSEAGFPMAHAIARAINLDVARPAEVQRGGARGGRPVAPIEIAVAVGPKNVVVKIPSYEAGKPAGFITRVLQTEVFDMPQQQARVTIHRASKQIAVSGNVTLSPTILFVPGLGSITIGVPPPAGADAPTAADAQPQPAAPVAFEAFLRSMAQANVPPAQIVAAVEQLHSGGFLHGQLIYRE